MNALTLFFIGYFIFILVLPLVLLFLAAQITMDIVNKVQDKD